MQRLIFISRVALICNILFLLSLCIQRVKGVFTNADLNNYIVILGWFVSPVLNAVLLIPIIVYAFLKKKTGLHLWLLIINILFFAMQMAIRFF